jgi:acyl CoA:acetate/3-ketoacid CoA transferase alpha subunit
MDPFFQDIIKTRFALAHEEGESKVVPLAEAIRRNVEDGMSIHFLGLHYRSHAAIYELFRQFRNRRPNFTIMAGTLHGPIMTLFHAGMIKKAVTAIVGEAYPTMGPNPVYNRIFRHNGVAFENWSFLTFTLRLLAGAMGIGFLPTRSLMGSDMAVANDKDYRPIDDPFGEASGLAAVRRRLRCFREQKRCDRNRRKDSHDRFHTPKLASGETSRELRSKPIRSADGSAPQWIEWPGPFRYTRLLRGHSILYGPQKSSQVSGGLKHLDQRMDSGL